MAEQNEGKGGIQGVERLFSLEKSASGREHESGL